VPHEKALQLGHRRPFDAEREIASDLGRGGSDGMRRVAPRLRTHRLASRNLALVVGGEVDSADNADLSVNDHDFPVVAVVGRVASSGLNGWNSSTLMPAAFRRSKNSTGELLDP
jgi:hypothetical protein